MRLIDADELTDILGFENTQEERDENVGEIITLDDIDRIPTSYDIEKVVEKLEEHFNATNDKGARLAYHHAIQIVKGGGVDG